MRDTANIIVDEIGNFRDCIDNMVYNLQKYSDKFLQYIPNHAVELRQNGCDEETVGFLICEGEEILRHKLLFSAIESHVLLTRKLTALIKKVESTDEKTHSFLFAFKVDNLKRNKEALAPPEKTRNYHYNADTIDSEIYNYTKYLDKVDTKYKDIDFGTPEAIKKDELIHRLKQIKETVEHRILKLRASMEAASSCYATSIYMRVIIEYLVCTFHIESNVIISEV